MSRVTFLAVAALTALLAAAPVAVPAPVPAGSKPAVECVLTRDAKQGALDARAFTAELKNNTDQPIDLLSTLPGGVLVFLDVQIEDAKGKRVSPEFYDQSIASPFAPPPKSIGKLEPGKSLKIELFQLSRYFEKPDAIVPGKYRVRVKFRYDKHTAVSEWLPVEVGKDGK